MIDHEPLAATVRSFAGRRVLIAGDVMLDEYVRGAVRRISPEAAVPIVEVQRRDYFAGGAANTAANVAALGGRALLASVIGADAAGRTLNDLVKSAGIEALLVSALDRKTTVKSRIVAHQQIVVRVDSEDTHPVDEASRKVVIDWIEERIRSVDAVIVSDYAKGVIDAELCRAIIDSGRRCGQKIVVDPKQRDFTVYRGATLVTPNTFEARQALEHAGRKPGSAEDDARALSELVDGTAVLLTRGAEGMTLAVHGCDVVQVPTRAREVFDVTGAGDTVVAALALALAAGADLREAAHIASAAAAVAVSHFGTATVSVAELLSELRAASTRPGA